MDRAASKPASRKGLFGALALLVVVAVAISGWFAFNSTKQVPPATFTLLSGEKVSTGDLKGKVYLINFWATNCETCMQEMPDMVKTYDQFKKDGLGFVAVAMNFDTPSYVRNYAKSRDLPFMVAIDDGSAAKHFGNVQLTPTTFLVDREGHILKRYVGEPSFPELHALIQQALSKAA
jgi:peroxiredoxin